MSKYNDLLRKFDMTGQHEAAAAIHELTVEHDERKARLAPAVPSGFKLVPIEPTDDMEAAAEDDFEQGNSHFPDWKRSYRAMVAAAPQPVAPDGFRLVQTPITEVMHFAAVKVLHRATGVDGLPQRMLDAMFAAQQPAAPAQDVTGLIDLADPREEALHRVMELLCTSPAVVDTVWHTPHETLHDYCHRAIDEGQARAALAQQNKNAERYLWLRDALDNEEITEGLHEAFMHGSGALDSAIDAAIAQQAAKDGSA